MSELIGFNRAAVQLASRIAEQMVSVRPFMAFSIRGTRRSGRSTFFSRVAKYLNDKENSCQAHVAQLEKADPEGFAGAIVTAIQACGFAKHDYSNFKDSLATPAGFFSLCAAFNQNENASPVILLDMGPALEDAFSREGIEGVNGVTRMLRQIFNLLEERNIHLTLGIGTTLDFVRQVEEFAGDVYIHRYQPVITLSNSQLEDPREKHFQAIVDSVCGVTLPDRFACLWRGDRVCPAQLGENLKASGTTEMTGGSLWSNMRGTWNILPKTDAAGVAVSDLGELVLADAVVSENLHPTFLEECDGGFRASDSLYEEFGLFSPRRDPSVRDRLKRRVQDPDDDEILGEILTAICESLRDFGVSDIGPFESCGQKSAVVTAKLESLVAPDLNETEREIFQAALPRELLVVLFLSSSPAEDDLERIVRQQIDRDGLVLVLYLEGVDPGRIPFGRFLKDQGTKSSFPLPFEMIAQLLCGSREAVIDRIGEWISQTTQDLFTRKPPLSVTQSLCKAMISATVSEGVVPIDVFARQRNITQTDAKKALAHLVEPPILTKKGNEISWDPNRDVVLKSLIDHAPDPLAIQKSLQERFLVATLDVEDLLALYESVLGNSGIEGVSSEKVVSHADDSHSFHLDVAKKALEAEPQLGDEWAEKIRLLSSRKVVSLEDVAPFRTDVLRLRKEIEAAVKSLQDERRQEAHDLEKKKESIKSQLEAAGNHFRPEEQDEFLQRIDKAKKPSSQAFRKIENAIRKRQQEVKDFELAVSNASQRLAKLQSFASETKIQQCEAELESLENLITSLNLESASSKQQAVDKILTDLEDARDRKTILSRSAGENASRATQRPPAKPGNAPPSLGEKNLESRGETSSPPPLQPPPPVSQAIEGGVGHTAPQVPTPNDDAVSGDEITSPTSEPAFTAIDVDKNSDSGLDAHDSTANTAQDDLSMTEGHVSTQEFDLMQPDQRRALLAALIERRAHIESVEIRMDGKTV